MSSRGYPRCLWRRAALALLSVVLVSAVARSSEAALARPEGIEPKSVLIPERLERLSAAIQGSIDRGEIPGAVVLIAHHGTPIYQRAFGYRDIESQEAMTVELLTSPRVSFEKGGPPTISVAFEVSGTPGQVGALTSPGAFSWGGAFYTTYFADPQEEILGIFLSQGRPIQSSIRYAFSGLVYQALE